ncbi:MAG: hypothetical protein PHH11_11915 [Methylomonas sp.]|nr:hypothetical protein [Methylomonas sp.]
MKYSLIAVLLLAANPAFAEDSAKDEWNETVLNETTIEKIQQAQFNYKKCVVEEMKKPDHASLESRHATDAIIKQCESTLGEMRKIYTDAQVPGVIADRHLKKLRIQVTRSLLQELMYMEAAKKSGAS